MMVGRGGEGERGQVGTWPSRGMVSLRLDASVQGCEAERGGGNKPTHVGRSGGVEADLVAGGQDVVKPLGGEGDVAEGFKQPACKGT